MTLDEVNFLWAVREDDWVFWEAQPTGETTEILNILNICHTPNTDDLFNIVFSISRNLLGTNYPEKRLLDEGWIRRPNRQSLKSSEDRLTVEFVFLLRVPCDLCD